MSCISCTRKLCLYKSSFYCSYTFPLSAKDINAILTVFIYKENLFWLGGDIYADFTTAFSLPMSFIMAVFLSLPDVHPLLEVKYLPSWPSDETFFLLGSEYTYEVVFEEWRYIAFSDSVHSIKVIKVYGRYKRKEEIVSLGWLSRFYLQHKLDACKLCIH